MKFFQNIPWKYIIKRVFLLIPVTFLIALVTFFISINAPGDPVEFFLNLGGQTEGRLADKLATEQAYIKMRSRLGLDLPIFYFTIQPACYPDTLYRIPGKETQEILKRLAWETGEWKVVQSYYHSIKKFEYNLYQYNWEDDFKPYVRKLREITYTLLRTSNLAQIDQYMDDIELTVKSTPYLNFRLEESLKELLSAYSELKNTKKWVKRYIPEFVFYGIKNQFHTWLFGDAPWFSSKASQEYRSRGILRGDFGISYVDKRPVSGIISDALPWTMSISIISIILAYLISIPVGVYSAIKRNQPIERIITVMLFLLYSMPSFWVGSMAVIFLCSPDYLNIFPAVGAPVLPADIPFLEKAGAMVYHMILPVGVWTYSSLAFISRQVRGSVLNTLDMDFVRTARAKGLPETTVIWKHVFRNSLIPVITLFSYIFPAAVTGSFVVEQIFSIPGMGKVALDAIVARDYPVVFADTLLVTVMTLIGMLVGDILYAVVDPRVSYEK